MCLWPPLDTWHRGAVQCSESAQRLFPYLAACMRCLTVMSGQLGHTRSTEVYFYLDQELSRQIILFRPALFRV